MLKELSGLYIGSQLDAISIGVISCFPKRDSRIGSKMFRLTGLAIGILIASMKASAYSVGESQESERQGLAIIEVNENTLDGEYHGSLGTIRFLVTSKEGETSLTVNSSELEEPIVISNKPRGSSKMTMTTGKKKVQAKNLMSDFGRGLPKYSQANYIDPAILQNRISEEEYPLSKNADIMAPKEPTAVENLISRDEGDLIIEAAKALGSTGVMGTDSVAAQKFYELGMRLEKIKDRERSQVNNYRSFQHTSAAE